jgi:hypothetical protein
MANEQLITPTITDANTGTFFSFGLRKGAARARSYHEAALLVPSLSEVWLLGVRMCRIEGILYSESDIERSNVVLHREDT